MDLQIGGKISLKLGDDPQKVEGILVGAEEPNFIIVRLIKESNSPSIAEGQSYAATYMSMGTIYRVHNSVLGFLKKLNLLVLSYPVTYEQDNLRREPRINCSIPATAKIDKNALKGLITDISSNGCQFIVKIPTTFRLYSISVLKDIDLSSGHAGEPRTPPTSKVRSAIPILMSSKLHWELNSIPLEDQTSSQLTDFIKNLRMAQ